MEKDRDKKSKLYVLLIAFVIVMGITVQLVDVFHRYQTKKQEVEELHKKIEKEAEYHDKLKEREKFMSTDAFVEEKAREEFNLIKEGEEVFILQKE